MAAQQWEDASKGCTAKALVVGLVGAVCLGLGSTYNDMIVKGSGLAVWNLTPGAILLFFLVILGNGLTRWIYPRLALARGELAVVFFLLLLANTLSGRGLPVQLLPVMTGAHWCWGGDYGRVDVVAIPLRVVAFPPAGLSHQLRLWYNVV